MFASLNEKTDETEKFMQSKLRKINARKMNSNDKAEKIEKRTISIKNNLKLKKHTQSF